MQEACPAEEEDNLSLEGGEQAVRAPRSGMAIIGKGDEEEKDNGPPGWEVEILLAGGFRLTQRGGGDGASDDLAMAQCTFDAVFLWWVWRGRFSQTGS